MIAGRINNTFSLRFEGEKRLVPFFEAKFSQFSLEGDKEIE